MKTLYAVVIAAVVICVPSLVFADELEVCRPHGLRYYAAGNWMRSLSPCPGVVDRVIRPVAPRPVTVIQAPAPPPMIITTPPQPATIVEVPPPVVVREPQLVTIPADSPLGPNRQRVYTHSEDGRVVRPLDVPLLYPELNAESVKEKCGVADIKEAATMASSVSRLKLMPWFYVRYDWPRGYYVEACGILQGFYPYIAIAPVDQPQP